MKSVLSGICLMVVVAGLAWVILGTQSVTSGESFLSSNDSVRLDD